MKSPAVTHLAIMLTILALAGCETVVTTVPIGERATLDTEERSFLTGTWVVADQALRIHAERDGAIQVAMIEWNDDRFELTRMSGYLSRHEDRLYLLLEQQDQPETEQPRYDFFRLTPMTPNTLVLYPAQTAYFRTAVESDEVAGRITRRSFSAAQQETAKRTMDEDALEQVDLEADADVSNVRTIVLDDQQSLSELIDPALIGQQFMVDTPIVLRKLIKSP